VALDVASLVAQNSQNLEGNVDENRIVDYAIDNAVRREFRRMMAESVQYGRIMFALGITLGAFAGFVVAYVVLR
jgi:hypothetical protein